MNNEERLKLSWQRQDENELKAAVQALYQHRHGRRLLWWLLTIGKVGTQPYAGNALSTAFSCGELNVGQQILDRIIAVSPDDYVLMLKENQDERTERDQQLGRAIDADRAGTEWEPSDERGDDGGKG